MVSVIIPTYNCSKYILFTIDSVIKQTLRDIELIVIDDGSTDNTKEILCKYSNNIRYFFQDNKGPAAARNRGIKESRGEYIAFLDADDIWLEAKLEKQYNLLKENKNTGLVFTGINIIDANGKLLYEKQYNQQRRGNVLTEILSRCFILTPSQVMIRKEIINNIGLYNEDLWYSDWEFYIRIAKFYNFDYVNESLTIYRKHPRNLFKDIKVRNKFTFTKLDVIWSDNDMSKKYSKIRRSVYSLQAFELAVCNLNALNICEAIHMFIKTILYNPTSLQTYNRICTYIIQVLIKKLICEKNISCAKLA